MHNTKSCLYKSWSQDSAFWLSSENVISIMNHVFPYIFDSVNPDNQMKLSYEKKRKLEIEITSETKWTLNQ